MRADSGLSRTAPHILHHLTIMQQDKQDAAIEALFAAYFLNEQCLSDPAVLRACAAAAGLTGIDEVQRAAPRSPYILCTT